MAKMFYTLDEAAKKLGKSASDVRGLVESGQLQEFRQNNELVVKREQVDLLAGSDDVIPLADSGETYSLSDSGVSSTGGGENTKERSGISIFEADELDETSDASAQTQVTQSVGGVKMTDPNASGSGLLDLTRDASDDTGIGAGLLNDVYSDKDSGSNDMAVASGGGGGGGLFESPAVSSDVGMAAAGVGGMMIAAAPVDKTWSGLGAGLAFGMVVTALVALFVVISGQNNAITGVVQMLTQNALAVAGGLAGLTLVAALVGWVLGRK